MSPPLIVVENFRAMFYAPFYLAQTTGAYAAEGVVIDLQASPSPTDSGRRIAEGSADVMWGGPLRVLMDHDLDLSHVPLKHAVPELEAVLAVSGQEIRPGDTVMLYMGTNERLLGRPGYLHDFPGLALESVHWLADKGIGLFGVEAVSPAPEGKPKSQAHLACGERGITHMECLANLDKLVGRGRFCCIGFPLRIRGGTASPIRAVAIFE